jgi:ATP-dependent DNA ligase
MQSTVARWKHSAASTRPVPSSGISEFGLEGLVSKHRDRAYRAGASPNWLKVKNPAHPAMTHVMEAKF